MEPSRLHIDQQDTQRVPTIKGNPEAYCIEINRIIKLGFKVYSSDGYGFYPVINIALADVRGLMIVTTVKHNFQVHDIVDFNHPLVVRQFPEL